jgi:hypothetical protein
VEEELISLHEADVFSIDRVKIYGATWLKSIEKSNLGELY